MVEDRFPTTMWTNIARAGNEDPMASDAVARRYYPAVLSYLRGQGLAASDSDDMAQEVFLQLFSKDVLARADREKGRFRALLVTVTKRVVQGSYRKGSAQKRGGGAKAVSLDLVSEPHAGIGEEIEDEDFDRGWASNIMALAMKDLAEECDSSGKRYHRALTMFLRGKAYQEIADELKTSLTNVSSWIRRAKLRLKILIDEEVQTYSSTEEEYRQEALIVRRYVDPGPDEDTSS